MTNRWPSTAGPNNKCIYVDKLRVLLCVRPLLSLYYITEMSSRPDSFAEVSLATPDTPLNSNHPLWSSTSETATTSTPCDSELIHTSCNSSPLLPSQHPDLYGEEIKSSPHSKKGATYVRPVLLFFSAVLVAVAVVVPVYFVVVKHQHHTSESDITSSSGSSSTGSHASPTYGADGSTVTTSDGSTFTYNNPFGGYCE